MTNVFACWALLHTWCLIYACISVACMRNDKCCARSWSGAGLHSASSGRSMEIYILYAEHCHVHRLCFHLCYECGIWSMLCLLMVWCQPAFDHGQTRHGICISYMQSIVMSMAYDLCFRWCCFICILKFCFVHWIWSVLGLLMVGCINVCNHWQMQHRICVCMLNFARKCLGEYNIMMKLCIRIFDGAFI